MHYRSKTYALLIATVCLFLFTCSQVTSKVNKPGDLDSGTSTQFDHSGISNNCIGCHKKDRPLSVTGVEHGGGQDCITCHAFEPTNLSWKSRTPFAHDPKPELCESCHGSRRPVPPHAESGDCVSCHNHPDWKAAFAFTHQPAPNTCVGCHSSIRPAAPHVQDGDCVSCHKHPEWKTILAFNHEPKPETCNECHTKDRPAAPHTQAGDCITCHTFPNWKAIVTFSHVPKPEKCEECHSRPQTTGRRAYPNQGPPANFNANDKTFPGSGHYVGQDCRSCHRTPAEGAQVFAFTHSVPLVPFCLSCHYNDGIGEHRNDGRATFTETGNCYNCHKNFDAASGRNWGRQ